MKPDTPNPQPPTPNPGPNGAFTLIELPVVRKGFTLIELLVVLTIVAIMVGGLATVLSAMQRGAAVSSGINTISAAVTASRAFATRDRSGEFTDIADTGSPGTNDGAAILFTPGGEIRIVENDPDAEQIGGSLIGHPTPPYVELKLNTNGVGKWNAYRDVKNRDYIKLPNSTGVAGVRRTGAGLEFMPPPFAVRFDRTGALIGRAGAVASGDQGLHAEDGHVYYDANADGQYRFGSAPGSTSTNPYGGGAYNASSWDWRDNPDDPNLTLVGDPPRRPLPYEQIDPVIGVVVFDISEFRAAGGWGMSDPVGWMNENGKVVFFSRYTGTVMRE